MRKCMYCNKPFSPHHPSQKFCSRRCKDRWWNKMKPDRHRDPDYYSKYNEAHGRQRYNGPYEPSQVILDADNMPAY